ncbi:hypothetical protein KP509_37G056400 [Ceratopteris richardii]|nr:hypothetical protein KP509_37G056400 [Ceratopteris richardii]
MQREANYIQRCCRQLIIPIICLTSLMMHPIAGDNSDLEIGFSIPRFDSLNNIFYESPTNDGELLPPVQISGNDLFLTPDPSFTITNKQLYYIGRIVYNQSFEFIPPETAVKEVSSFNTSFTFQIKTTNTYGKCGDGLAFFITSDLEPPPNSTGRYLGLESEQSHESNTAAGITRISEALPSSKSTFFAVEFDTFQNVEFNDPSASHIGFDINSLNSSAYLDTSGDNECCRSNQDANEPGECPFCSAAPTQIHTQGNDSKRFVKGFYPELFLYANYTLTAWIEYHAEAHLIQLWMTNQSSDKRPDKPCLTMEYNLTEIFQPKMFVGLSAASGANFEGTIIYSWDFSLYVKKNKCSSKKMEHSVIIIIICLLTAVIMCTATVIRTRKSPWRRTNKGDLRLTSLESLSQMDTSQIAIPRYSYRSLKKAVNGFNESARIGRGGFSSVYKGVLEGRQVAIKRLKDGVAMEVEFLSEIQIISQIRHRNLLHLQGWCYEKGKALLVYDYMPNGSLDAHLFGSTGSETLDCDTRLKILNGVASALEYLHGGLEQCVLHRDIKAANVLLTDNFEALLGDFGLARLITHNQAVTMTAAGTPGYVAPEVVYTGKATDKADVYAFGVLAVELACGRRVIDSHEVHLIDWVWSLHQNGNIIDAIDPRLQPASTSYTISQSCIERGGGEEDDDTHQGCDKSEVACSHDSSVSVELIGPSSMEHKWRCVLHLGLLCCHPCADARPTMRQVNQALQEHKLLHIPPYKPIYYPSFSFSLSHSTLSISEHYTCPPSLD